MKRYRVTDKSLFDRHYRFSIRKFSVGVASVAISAFMMANPSVAAEEKLESGNLDSTDKSELEDIDNPTKYVAPAILETESALERTVQPVAIETMDSKEVSIPDTIARVDIIKEEIKREETISEGEALEEVPVSGVSERESFTSAGSILESRIAIPYAIIYREEETGTPVLPANSSIVTTKEELRLGITVTELAQDIPKGYELAPNQSVRIDKEIHEFQDNILSFAIVKSKQDELGVESDTWINGDGDIWLDPELDFVEVKFGESVFFKPQSRFRNSGDGYSISKPNSPTISDSKPNRYTYAYFQEQSTNTYYVLSVDEADLAKSSETRRLDYAYVTRIRDGRVLSQERISNLGSPRVVKTFDDGVTLSLDESSYKGKVVNNYRFQKQPSSIKNLYSMISTPSDKILDSLSIDAVAVVNQVTKYLDNNTGEEVHPTRYQTGYNGYDYTTTKIDIDNYRYVKSTDNVNGVVSSREPRNQGDVSYLMTRTVAAGDNIVV